MTYQDKPSSAPAIPFNSVGRSKNLNDIFSAIAVESLLGLKKDGTYENNFSIGDNSLNALVNQINIRQGSTIKEYDSTGANLLRTLTLGSATTTAQGFRYLDESIKISNNATNPLTEIDVSAGVINFDDGSGQVLLPTSLTKSTANDFANGGLLPNSTVLQTNTWYYVFVIYSTASNLVSFYADTNFSSPTLPASPNVYDKKQYRGAFYVDASGNIARFFQDKDQFKFQTEKNVLFINSSIPTSFTPLPITVPRNGQCEAIMTCFIQTNQFSYKFPEIFIYENGRSSVGRRIGADGRGRDFTGKTLSPFNAMVDTNGNIQYRSTDRGNYNLQFAVGGWRDFALKI